MGAKGASSIFGGVLSRELLGTNPILGGLALYVSYKASDKVIDNKENDEVIKEIFEQLKKCIEHKIYKPLNSFDWNKLNYESKPAKDISDSIKILKANLPMRNNSNIIDSFKDYIYDNTPLKKALSKSIEIINKDSEETIKLIFILSDGESTDGNPNDLKYLLNKKNVYIISCYFSSNKVKQPKQLYFHRPIGTNGLAQLYDLATEINPYSPIFDMLEERGWKVDYTKKSKLFVQANNIEVFEEFFGVVNSFVNGNNILGNMIAKIELDDYISSYNKNHRINENQNGQPTCWCHSLAKVIEYASHRIYRGKYLDTYPYPVFSDLKNYLINKYNANGKSDYKMANILDEILPKYFLRYSYYNTYNIQEDKIKTALMRGRPLVLTYFLSAKQWWNFENFFNNNKKGILNKEIVNKNIPKYLYENIKDSRHAVILIEYNEDGFVCLNSWGKDFGDNGKFRIKNLNV